MGHLTLLFHLVWTGPKTRAEDFLIELFLGRRFTPNWAWRLGFVYPLVDQIRFLRVTTVGHKGWFWG